MTVTDLAEAIRRLRAAGCVFAEDEAAVLGEAATDARHLAELVGRRALGEPLEQVVGYADFCGVRVRLRPGVFVPRVRSELLVRTAAAENGGVVVDLCCGSGALGLALRRQRPDITLFAADNDPTAVACARDNLGSNANQGSINQGNANQVNVFQGDTNQGGLFQGDTNQGGLFQGDTNQDGIFQGDTNQDVFQGGVFQGDLFDALPAGLRGRIDILLANVPYVATRHIPLLPPEAREHEPHQALDGGDDGLDIFRAVVAGATRWLSPGGLMLSEISAAQTGAAVAAVRAAGLRPGLAEDEELDARVVTARRLEVPEVPPLR
ncbi:methyltransferase [Actinoplanes sp. NPDC049118]|uniref:methyltransferase n=1 Tax=Actinoplanes sp. NPDC049118 TaxID=3155769 RepID=UPI0033C866B5